MMQPTIHYKPGDVILIPFPFTDFSTLKQRPALVISSSTFNESQSDIIVAAITSHIIAPLRNGEFLIPEHEKDKSGLLGKSIIKLGKIVTIDKRLVRKSLGNLSNKTTKTIVSEIHKILDCN